MSLRDLLQKVGLVRRDETDYRTDVLSTAERRRIELEERDKERELWRLQQEFEELRVRRSHEERLRQRADDLAVLAKELDLLRRGGAG